MKRRQLRRKRRNVPFPSSTINNNKHVNSNKSKKSFNKNKPESRISDASNNAAPVSNENNNSSAPQHQHHSHSVFNKKHITGILKNKMPKSFRGDYDSKKLPNDKHELFMSPSGYSYDRDCDDIPDHSYGHAHGYEDSGEGCPPLHLQSPSQLPMNQLEKGSTSLPIPHQRRNEEVHIFGHKHHDSSNYYSRPALPKSIPEEPEGLDHEFCVPEAEFTSDSNSSSSTSDRDSDSFTGQCENENGITAEYYNSCDIDKRQDSQYLMDHSRGVRMQMQMHHQAHLKSPHSESQSPLNYNEQISAFKPVVSPSNQEHVRNQNQSFSSITATTMDHSFNNKMSFNPYQPQSVTQKQLQLQAQAMPPPPPPGPPPPSFFSPSHKDDEASSPIPESVTYTPKRRGKRRPLGDIMNAVGGEKVHGHDNGGDSHGSPNSNSSRASQYLAASKLKSSTGERSRKFSNLNEGGARSGSGSKAQKWEEVINETYDKNGMSSPLRKDSGSEEKWMYRSASKSGTRPSSLDKERQKALQINLKLDTVESSFLRGNSNIANTPLSSNKELSPTSIRYSSTPSGYMQFDIDASQHIRKVPVPVSAPLSDSKTKLELEINVQQNHEQRTTIASENASPSSASTSTSVWIANMAGSSSSLSAQVSPLVPQSKSQSANASVSPLGSGSISGGGGSNTSPASKLSHSLNITHTSTGTAVETRLREEERVNVEGEEEVLPLGSKTKHNVYGGRCIMDEVDETDWEASFGHLGCTTDGLETHPSNVLFSDVHSNLNSTAEIEQCVLNDLEFQLGSTTLGSRAADSFLLHSKQKSATAITPGTTRSNNSSTAEVAECVADILEQTCAENPSDESDGGRRRGGSNSSPHNIRVRHQRPTPSKNIHNSDNNREEVQKCVADFFDQTKAPKSILKNRRSAQYEKLNINSSSTGSKPMRTSISSIRNIRARGESNLSASTRTTSPGSYYSCNSTIEVAECVADVLDQTRAPNSIIRNRRSGHNFNAVTPGSNFKSNSTMEVAECIADVLDQTQATDSAMHKGRSKYLFASRSVTPTADSVATSTAEVAECVADILEQSQAPDSVMRRYKKQVHTNELEIEFQPSNAEKEEAFASLCCNNIEHFSQDEIFATEESHVFSPDIVDSNCMGLHNVHDINVDHLSKKISAHIANGEYEDALESMGQMMKLHTDEYGEMHPLVASCYHNIGIVHAKRANSESNKVESEKFSGFALESFRSAALTARRSVGKYHPNVAVSLARTGLIYLKKSMYEEADVTFEECLLIRKRAFGKKHPLVAKVYNNLGVAKLHRGNYEGGLKSFESAAHIQKYVLRKMKADDLEHSYNLQLELTDTLCNVGSMCLDLAEKRKFDDDKLTMSVLRQRAIDAFGEVIKIRTQWLGVDHNLVQEAKQLHSDAQNVDQISTREVQKVQSSALDDEGSCLISNSGHEVSVDSIWQEESNQRDILSVVDNTASIASVRNDNSNENELCDIDGDAEIEETNALAAQSLKEDKLEESLTLFRTLLPRLKSIHGELHHSVGSTLHNIGIVLLRSKSFEEALMSFQQAVRVRRGSIGRDHPDVAVSLVKVGIAQLLLRQFDEALVSFREALSVRRHALGHLHPSTARIYNNIGCVHVEFNELREARRAFESALDVQRNAICYEPETPELLFGAATTLCNLGYLYTYRGAHGKTCLVLKEAFELQQQVFGPSNSTVLSILDSLADAYGRTGDNANASNTYKEIIKRLENRDHDKMYEVSSQKKRALAVIKYKLSKIHRKQNDFDSAVKLLRESIRFVEDLGDPVLLKKVEDEINGVEEHMKKNDLDWL